MNEHEQCDTCVKLIEDDTHIYYYCTKEHIKGFVPNTVAFLFRFNKHYQATLSFYHINKAFFSRNILDDCAKKCRKQIKEFPEIKMHFQLGNL